MCNLKLKYVKDLKHQKGRKGSEYISYDENGNPDSFDDWTFAQEPHQVLHPRVFQEEWIFPSPKMSLFYNPRPV